MQEDRAFWNHFAADYAAAEQDSRLPLAHDVTTWMIANGLLPTDSLIDLAAGTGRFAIRLAPYVRHLTLIDWSSAMLTYAKIRLKANKKTSMTYLTDDWHQLVSSTSADLVFVSQLPTLLPEELSLLNALARKTVILNFQTQQDDALVRHALALLDHDMPVAYQADPSRVAGYQNWLSLHQIPFETHTLTYHLEEQTTVSDMLPELGLPVGVKAAERLAKALTGHENPHMPVTDHLTYAYTQLMWHPKN